MSFLSLITAQPSLVCCEVSSCWFSVTRSEAAACALNPGSSSNLHPPQQEDPREEGPWALALPAGQKDRFSSVQWLSHVPLFATP